MNKPIKNRSPIKALEVNAKKGNFDAIYQLYEYYLSGTYVELDTDKAEHYLQQAIAKFNQQHLRLEYLKINNFRAIKSLDFRAFDHHLTVIIGNNGAGKTTVLDAIERSLSWLVNRIVKHGGNGTGLDDLDINIDADDASVISRFNLTKKLYAQMELVKFRAGLPASKKSTIKDITKIGNIYKQVNTIQADYNLPLLAYYTVARANAVGVKDVADFDDTQQNTEHSKFEGYKDALNGKADFKAFFRWFKRIDDIDKHRKLKTQSAGDVDLGFINTLKQMAESDQQANQLLQNLMSTVDDNSKSQLQDDVVDVTKVKAILNQVIGHFMPGYGQLTIELEPKLMLTINKNDQTLNVLQLSQGEKSLLALLLDITRRLILLNPGRDNPLEGHGIVLIDEFDLHVHPQWQRTIIRGLPKLFENCQFIVTTHSPQILGEVKHNQVIILTQNDAHEIEQVRPKQSYGLTSNEILNELMLTNSTDTQLVRTPLVEQQLHDIYELIEDEDFDEAKQQIEKLEKELNGEIPELVGAKLDIDMAGWDD